MNEQTKGVGATVITGVSAVGTWLPFIETGLRVSASVIGIVAALYTIRYWHTKTKYLVEQHNKRKDTE